MKHTKTVSEIARMNDDGSSEVLVCFHPDVVSVMAATRAPGIDSDCQHCRILAYIKVELDVGDNDGESMAAILAHCMVEIAGLQLPESSLALREMNERIARVRRAFDLVLSDEDLKNRVLLRGIPSEGTGN